MKGFFVLFIIFLFLPPYVRAHTLETDGTIGAVLHVEPQDEPVVGQKATVFLDVKDTANKLLLSTCDCRVKITYKNSVIFSLALFPKDPKTTSLTFPFIFPEDGRYVVQLAGKPKLDGTFQPFTLSYEVQTAKEVPPTNSLWKSSTTIHIIHAGAIVAIFLGFLIYYLLVEKKKKK